MAKYEITYKCGHKETVQLFGKESGRERRIEWMKTQDCPECRKAAHVAEMAGKAESAKEAANEFGLPELRGSEKQVNWALDIRRKVIETVEADIKRLADGDAKAIAVFTKWAKVFSKETLNQASARFWIDEREHIGFIADEIISGSQKAAQKYFEEYFEAHGMGAEEMTREKLTELTNEMTA